MKHREIFTPQYALASGPGSTLAYSAPYREFLSTFIRANKIQSVVDLACGDGVVMSGVDLNGATYLGVDVIEERVLINRALYPGKEYASADLMSYEPPPADLLICKDAIQHWSNQEVLWFLNRLPLFQFRCALLTNCARGDGVNTDTPTGGWRPLDLTRAPFKVGELVFSWETKDVVLVLGQKKP